MIRETSVMNIPGCNLSISSALRLLTLRLRKMVETRQQNRIRRDAFLNLLYLDDVILDDIGVTRAEVERAAHLPLRINASDALAVAAHARRKEQSACKR